MMGTWLPETRRQEKSIHWAELCTKLDLFASFIYRSDVFPFRLTALLYEPARSLQNPRPLVLTPCKQMKFCCMPLRGLRSINCRVIRNKLLIIHAFTTVSILVHTFPSTKYHLQYNETELSTVWCFGDDVVIQHLDHKGESGTQNLTEYRPITNFEIQAEQRKIITLFDLQLDAQNSNLFTYNTFIKILYMFRALPCSSSGGLRRNCIYM
jgi:hypothetical protein